jgi:hypothetical protein
MLFYKAVNSVPFRDVQRQLNISNKGNKTQIHGSDMQLERKFDDVLD